MISNRVDLISPLGRDKAIDKIFELQSKVDKINDAIREAEVEVKTLTEEQDRLVRLIPSVHVEQGNLYKSGVAEAETSLKELKKVKLPALRKDLKGAEEAVAAALAKLKKVWTEEDVKEDLIQRTDSAYC